MPRIPPVRYENVPELHDILARGEKLMGYVSNDSLTMAHLPEVHRKWRELVLAIYGAGTLSIGFKTLIGLVASEAAGCRYCTAHTANGAVMRGVEEAKVTAIWEFETNPIFSAAERAALRVARDAALVPNAVDDGHFSALAEHFDVKQIVEIVAVISMMGFLNRWNDTIGTELETKPLAFASTHLPSGRWSPGKHQPT